MGNAGTATAKRWASRAGGSDGRNRATSAPRRTSSATQTIELGQTIEQVIAAFGQPQRIVKLPTKQIYFYNDLKVTFTNGKVSDVD